MTALAAWALVLGLTLGLGSWSLVSLAPPLNRPRLLFRVAPYVVDVSSGARALLARRPADPLPVLGALVWPIAHRAQTLLGGVLGGAPTIRLRLRQSGSPLSVEAFRARQLLWGLCGLGVGVALATVVARSQSLPFPLLVAIVALVGVAGVFARDYLLQRAASARLARMAGELPTVLEFLTLSLSAGEGIVDAIRRVSRISAGELATELSATVAAVNTGLPFATSLSALAEGLQLPPLTRSVEQIVGALERGTPLAEVLRAQAQDSREVAKRQLLETAGRKEVAMLVPLVFLILPMTIVFAIFPGIVVLQLGF